MVKYRPSPCLAAFACIAVLALAAAQKPNGRRLEEAILLRLVPSGIQGRLEVFRGGMWGTVCEEGFTDRAANVVCRQLGFSGGRSQWGAYFGEGSGPIHLKGANCTGLEPYLQKCSNLQWDPSDCDHSEDVSVVCYGTEEVHGLQLVNGPNAHQGKLVVKDHNGRLGTVCERGWRPESTVMVCRQLGFNLSLGVATAIDGSVFGTGDVPALMDGVACTGLERYLAACRFNGWNVTDCDAKTQTVSIDCTGTLPRSPPPEAVMSPVHETLWSPPSMPNELELEDSPPPLSPLPAMPRRPRPWSPHQPTFEPAGDMPDPQPPCSPQQPASELDLSPPPLGPRPPAPLPPPAAARIPGGKPPPLRPPSQKRPPPKPALPRSPPRSPLLRPPRMPAAPRPPRMPAPPRPPPKPPAPRPPPKPPAPRPPPRPPPSPPRPKSPPSPRAPSRPPSPQPPPSPSPPLPPPPSPPPPSPPPPSPPPPSPPPPSPPPPSPPPPLPPPPSPPPPSPPPRLPQPLSPPPRLTQKPPTQWRPLPQPSSPKPPLPQPPQPDTSTYEPNSWTYFKAGTVGEISQMPQQDPQGRVFVRLLCLTSKYAAALLFNDSKDVSSWRLQCVPYTSVALQRTRHLLHRRSGVSSLATELISEQAVRPTGDDVPNGSNRARLRMLQAGAPPTSTTIVPLSTVTARLVNSQGLSTVSRAVYLGGSGVNVMGGLEERFSCENNGFSAIRAQYGGLQQPPTRLALRCGSNWTSPELGLGYGDGVARQVVQCPSGMLAAGIVATTRALSPSPSSPLIVESISLYCATRA